MHKISLLLFCALFPLLLGGCFHKKNEEVTPPVPVVVDQVGDTDTIVDAKDDLVVDELPNEFDEEGEFDPSKFQDDDIDEVIDLLKELTAE